MSIQVIRSHPSFGRQILFLRRLVWAVFVITINLGPELLERGDARATNRANRQSFDLGFLMVIEERVASVHAHYGTRISSRKSMLGRLEVFVPTILPP
jgi:hypothetical protein